MFTDIVGSTEHATALGDRAWRDLLAEHHGLVLRELGRYRGKERDTAGDGFFATFDGPARAIRAAQAIVSGVNELGLLTNDTGCVWRHAWETASGQAKPFRSGYVNAPCDD
jgi:class 3 adenylate cyclase